MMSYAPITAGDEAGPGPATNKNQQSEMPRAAATPRRPGLSRQAPPTARVLSCRRRYRRRHPIADQFNHCHRQCHLPILLTLAAAAMVAFVVSGPLTDDEPPPPSDVVPTTGQADRPRCQGRRSPPATRRQHSRHIPMTLNAVCICSQQRVQGLSAEPGVVQSGGCSRRRTTSGSQCKSDARADDPAAQAVAV